ncbi:cysteine hydrolase [Anaerotruncus sp. AF02-27]|nr:cysteine hydrolase [Anaerotruncus sp. AF02-27]
MDSARTAFIAVDMQTDFCGKKGYVDVMGYDLNNTARALEPIANALEAVRGTDIKVIHTREGHEPDLSDAPFNKVLRSKIIGEGVGIGDVPENGLGRLLVRGEPNWDLHEKVYPIPGEMIIDKAGKGAFGSSTIHMVLKNLGITHIVICGITTDVCVHTIMREANDYGYWCVLMKDGTGATDMGNHEAAIKSVKMQGGVFGNVTDSKRFIEAVKAAGLK